MNMLARWLARSEMGYSHGNGMVCHDSWMVQVLLQAKRPPFSDRSEDI